MKRAKANPSHRRAPTHHRTGDDPCQLVCGGDQPATRCIAGVHICQPCFTKTHAIAAEADGRAPERIRTIIPRALAAIERRMA